MVITFASPFLIMIGLLFGPVYASVAYLVSDIISHLIRPLGPYMWEYALLLVVKGYLVGLLFNIIKKVEVLKYKKYFLLLNTFLLIFATYLVWTGYLKNIQNIIILSYVVLFLSSGINFIVYIVLNKKYIDLLGNYLKINFSIAIPYIISTVIATFIFKKYFNLTRETAFIILVPRVLEEVFMVILYSIVCSIFLETFKKYIYKGEIK